MFLPNPDPNLNFFGFAPLPDLSSKFFLSLPVGWDEPFKGMTNYDEFDGLLKNLFPVKILKKDEPLGAIKVISCAKE